METANTIAFINAVKKRPCLYDPENSRYRFGDERAKAWRDIAEEIGETNVNSLKMRWRSLKDCYIKHMRSLDPKLTSPLIKQHRNWRWAKYVRFLDKYLPRTSRSLFYQTKRKTFKNPENFIKTEPEQMTHDTDREMNETNLNFSEVFIENPVNNEKNQGDDIYYLFSSYAETFRKFSDRRRAFLKMELAKLFYRAELEEIEDNETNNLNIFNYSIDFENEETTN